MKTRFDTNRLVLRELVPSDDFDFFEMDSNPEVHLYLGNTPSKTLFESRRHISNIRQQYLENGIGRWAVIVKETGEFAGWSGLKIEKNVNGHQSFYDLGYRFKPKFWNRGFATEAAQGFVNFGFDELQLPEICAYVSPQNYASIRVLEKCGLTYVNTFEFEGADEYWYSIHNPKLTR